MGLSFLHGIAYEVWSVTHMHCGLVSVSRCDTGVGLKPASVLMACELSEMETLHAIPISVFLSEAC